MPCPDEPLPPAWASPGTYILVLRLEEPRTCRIGRLGMFDLPAGVYLYIGSAQGPGGLAGRVGRHLRQEKRLRWHIDYLLGVATIVDVWAAVGTERLECVWACRLLDEGGRVFVPGFGASDCRCATHLVHFLPGPDEGHAQIRQMLGACALNLRNLRIDM